MTDVADNSIAAAQDIQREDVITEVDGKPVTNVASFREALIEGGSAPRHSALPRSQGQPHVRGPEGWVVETGPDHAMMTRLLRAALFLFLSAASALRASPGGRSRKTRRRSFA